MRIIASIAMGLAFSWLVYSRAEAEEGAGTSGNGPKYMPYVAGYLLPLFVLLLFVLWRTFLTEAYANQSILSICFSLFLHISIYYAILLPLLPYLRRRISARACAMLWLIPNYLYLSQQSAMALPMPMFVLTTPGKLVWILLYIWLAGFIGVLIWKIAEHFRFRRRLLRTIERCSDLQMRQQWKLALAQARFKDQDIPLMISDQISTPVTVGLFQASTVVVLPRKVYSREELDLIFLHEIVHIGRMDPWNKFFLVFCTAMCWFNPLMWVAMAKSAEDMELSCDETVLLNADDTARKQYASLLLNTAGDGRGFTSCLSASAEALRYRLKNIVKPMEKSTGAAVVGITFFLLSLTCGFVALGYDGVPGSEVFYQSDNRSGYELTVLNADLSISEEELSLADGEGILSYLSGLTMYQITGQYSFQGISSKALLELTVPGSWDYWIFVYDSYLEVYPLSRHDARTVCYYVPEGIDWNHLSNLIDTN